MKRKLKFWIPLMFILAWTAAILFVVAVCKSDMPEWLKYIILLGA